MKEEYKDFIGIYDESVPVELCEGFVKTWDEAKENETIINLNEENNTGFREKAFDFVDKKDDCAYVSPLLSTIYPKPPVLAYFKNLENCISRYMEKYGIKFWGLLYNDVFKIHKVKKSEGYHIWHYENCSPQNLDRFIVYMTYLEVPKEGGETEFLHQSLRIKPIVGRTLIWPAGYTHMHRGLPPLDGEKMYITGWFTGSRADKQYTFSK